MDKKLLQELKKAGFPQRDKSGYIPDLEQLIDECGDKFGALTQYDREKKEGWFACGHKVIWDSDDLGFVQCEGETKKEAVARLWLLLNK